MAQQHGVIELRELIALCTWRKPRPSDVMVEVGLYIYPPGCVRMWVKPEIIRLYSVQ